MTDTTIRQYQTEVDQWITTIGVRYFSPLSNMLQLSEEVGEVARIVNRTAGEQSFKKNDPVAADPMRHLADELADCLFTIVCLANQHQIDLTEAVARNMDKKTSRDKERHAGATPS